VHPALRAAIARRTTEDLETLVHFNPPFGRGALDNQDAWTAVRTAALLPEPGDTPHRALRAILEDWSPEDAKRLAVLVWQRGGDDLPNADLWAALSAEVAAAGDVEGPEIHVSLDDLDDTELTVECGHCEELTPADTESILFCTEYGSVYEEPVCAACLGRSDADSCLKCGGVWWTGVTPPYTEENSPGSVCPSCFEEAVSKND